MPQTKLQIANSALVKIGGRTLTTLTDPVKEAELIAARFDPVRDTMLRGHTWTFLTAAEEMASEGASAVTPWLYYFALPDDCARIRSLTSGDYAVRYERIGNLIHVLETPLILRYVKNFSASVPEDVPSDEYPDDFAEALACYLAAEICVSLQDDASMRADLLQQYADSLRIARFNGAVERDGTDKVHATQWVDSRHLLAPYDRSAIDLDAP